MKERAVFVDIDGTLIDGIVAEGIGYGALGEVDGFQRLYGIAKGLQVKIGTHIFGEPWALETLAKSLAKAEVKKDKIQQFSDGYIERKLKEDAHDFLGYVSEETDLYILTTGFECGPNTLESKHGLKIAGKISNELIYNGNTEVVSSKIAYNDENIVRKVASLASGYSMVDIIDDRPHRYLELNGHSDMAVYSSIADFMKTRAIS